MAVRFRKIFSELDECSWLNEKTAKHVSEVEGRKVYLCSAGCKSQFEANPGKYGY